MFPSSASYAYHANVCPEHKSAAEVEWTYDDPGPHPLESLESLIPPFAG